MAYRRSGGGDATRTMQWAGWTAGRVEVAGGGIVTKGKG